MQTATDFISERGSTDFQMNEISDRCNLSKGALYYYFIDKADLMDAIFDQVIGDLVEQVEEAVSTAHTPLETIAGIVKTLVKCIRSERPLVFAMVESSSSRRASISPRRVGASRACSSCSNSISRMRVGKACSRRASTAISRRMPSQAPASTTRSPSSRDTTTASPRTTSCAST
ncbi:MAG: TetR/AcrR family transcriptional regulator [Atopobiaceae bacterium]|nr:TetR/AcrR family transcriptional regulator [Atopobiaceae bacterium]